MANIKSAKKRIRVIDKKTARNRRIKGHLKAVLKSFDAAIEAGDMETAEEKLRLAEKKLMQAAAKNTIHKKSCFQKSFQISQEIQSGESRTVSLTRPHQCIS